MKVVLVQWGKAPPTLPTVLRSAAQVFGAGDVVLVTDQSQPSSPWAQTVIDIADLMTPSDLLEVHDVLNGTKFSPVWRRGYWFGVFVRFWILERLAYLEEPVLHLESDVYWMMPRSLTLELVESQKWRAALPVLSEDRASPGVILAKDGRALAKAASAVISGLRGGDSLSDMESLRRHQLQDQLGALPVTPEQAWRGWVFDAAQIGQYLFGADPRNTNGIRRGGFVDPTGVSDPSRWQAWRVDQFSQRLEANSGEQQLSIGCLHMHAKVPMPPLTDETWQTVLAAANGLIPFERSVDKPKFAYAMLTGIAERAPRLKRAARFVYSWCSSLVQRTRLECEPRKS